MRKLVGVLAGGAIVVGMLTLVTPTPATGGNGPTCPPDRWCGSPEPGFECPPCEYWDSCGPHCGCRAIPGCKP